jgi:hypothetical protein
MFKDKKPRFTKEEIYERILVEISPPPPSPSDLVTPGREKWLYFVPVSFRWDFSALRGSIVMKDSGSQMQSWGSTLWYF